MVTGSDFVERSGLAARRTAFFASFPKSQVLDKALRAPDNPTPLFFLALDRQHPDLKDVGFAIGRLGPDIERQYLINGEVAFFFAPWRDFQRRSFNAMTHGLQAFSRSAQGAGLGERFTPSSKVVILVSEDSRVEAKVEEWQLGSDSPTVVVAVPIDGGDPVAARVSLLTQLRARLGDRDLYRTQNPVTGDDFFGRQALLRDASAAIQSDENIVILGLRRSGKTSVLSELKRQLLPRKVILTLGDFQALEKASVQSLAVSIARNLVDDLRNAREAGLSIRIGDDREQNMESITLPELADRVKRAANRNPNVRLVLAIDEIESAARIARTEPEQIRTLLGALRTAAQACPNVSLAFAGVANRMFKSTVLGSGSAVVDNPMFGQVTSFYITSFEEEETSDLLRKLGRPMFLEWDDEAIHEVQVATGGMPYFVRNLASAVRRSMVSAGNGERFAMSAVTSNHLRPVLHEWREQAGHDWVQLIDALRLHYPDAADLLDPSLSQSELAQWIVADSKAKDAAEDLCQLGLLARSATGESWYRTEALVAIHGLLAGRPSSEASAEGAPGFALEEGLLSLVKRGESRDLELKETFRINTYTGQRDERMETEIARAVVGLMNSDGGHVVVGVHDSGEIKGLVRDMVLFKSDMDKFERWVLGDLLGRRIDQSLVSQLVRLEWVAVRGAVVCHLRVARASAAAWLDDEHLHVRAGNQTLELAGRKLGQFLAERG